MSLYYFDYASVAPLSQSIASIVTDALKDHPYSILQPHTQAQQSIKAVENALDKIYTFFHLNPSKDQCVITSSAAEAVSQITQSVFHLVSRESGKNHFVTTKTDEAASIMSLGRLEKQGAVITLAETKEGVITADTISEALTPRTALVIMHHVNGLTGHIHPIEEIIKVCRDRGALFALDISHSYGYIDIDIHALDIDFLIFEGSQIGAPRGIGGLIIKQDRYTAPLIAGAAELGQYRAGALNIPYLIGLAAALEKSEKERMQAVMEVARLRRRFENKLAAIDGVQPLFTSSQRVPHISCISFEGVHQEALNYLLNKNGVQACMGGGSFQQLALNLQSTGIPDAQSYTALSFSFSEETTMQVIDESIPIIEKCYQELKTLSKDLDLKEAK